MKKQKKTGILVTMLTAGMLAAALTSTAHAAWYTVKVFQVVPRTSSGDVFVQLQPGATETRFTGTVRGILPGTEPGTNKIMAVMLAAVALNSEITVEMANLPSFANPQVITGSGILAP